MTALSREDATRRNNNPHHLVARQLLVLLKLGQSPSMSDVILYTNIKEPAAHNLTDLELMTALIVVERCLRSSPMDVMNL
jgi:hypothetical protein